MANLQARLLVVDDDPLNVQILLEYLEDAGYQTVTASGGEEAWALLERQAKDFYAVLLDRMMPGMDGMEVLSKMKSVEGMKVLPVIMQTAAASPHEVREGIEAGAFYYLTKPFQKEVLLAIVQAAVSNYAHYRALREQVEQSAPTLSCMKSGLFQIRTLEEAYSLARLLSGACPNPGKVIMGLVEMLVNAVEHGNLQITYHEKTRMQEEESWEQEIASRLALPENADKRVEVWFERRPEEVTITIKDQGPGFDWKRYLEMSPDLAFQTHGRGIAMARALCFDGLDYLGVGNEVVCTTKVSGEAKTEEHCLSSSIPLRSALT